MKLSDASPGLHRSGTDVSDYDAMFKEENERFFDYTEALHNPDCLITFQNMRMLLNVCLLPNMHLLIEGGLMA